MCFNLKYDAYFFRQAACRRILPVYDLMLIHCLVKFLMSLRKSCHMNLKVDCLSKNDPSIISLY